jgi:hypothetical protein
MCDLRRQLVASVLCPSTEGNKSPFLHAQCGVLVIGSVSKVELWTPRALIYRVLFPSISTFG